MYECQDCFKKFKDIKKFEDHKDTSINCKKYKNILFICEKCNFETKGIKNINFHIENCNSEKSKNINFKKLYEIQKLENGILRDIIKKNLSIEISEIIKYDKNTMDIYENNNFEINIHRKENVEKIEYTEKLHLEVKNIKKETYRKSKYIEIRNEPTQEEKNNMINEIDKENLLDNKENENDCEDLFLEIKNNRIYSKTLMKIKNWRLKKSNYLNFQDYIELIKLHISKLEEVFNNKKYNNKKIIQTISKCLCPFELKLLEYGNYYLEEFNNDDIQYLTNILHQNVNKDYIFFDSKQITRSLFNICSNIFTLQDNLKRILKNKYSFNNIIYLCPKKGETNIDYYSFYTLTKIENDIRCWEMDCRLHKLTNTIINDLYLYLVEIFRKYYYCIFHDNEYRDNFEDNSPIFVTECKQLLQTITFLCNQRNVNRFIRDFIKENCEYKPTNMDKFNIYSDDPFLKKNYKTKYKHDLNIFTIIDKIFDNISSKQISNFYENNIKEHE